MIIFKQEMQFILQQRFHTDKIMYHYKSESMNRYEVIPISSCLNLYNSNKRNHVISIKIYLTIKQTDETSMTPFLNLT